MNPLKQVDILIKRYPELAYQRDNIIAAYNIMEKSYSNKGKHIVGELMKGFENPRKLDTGYIKRMEAIDIEMGKVLGDNLQGGLPAIALDGHLSLSTAYMNDCEPLLCFAQQVNGFGKENDVFLAISTSGNSKNILYAATVAKAKGMKVIGLTGVNDSKLSDMADVTIRSSEKRTYMIQEHHLPIYHCLCLMLEERFFGGNN